MVLSRIIPSLIIGLASAALGFVLSRSFFAPRPLGGFPFLGEALAGFLAGTAGVFVVPLVFRKAKEWFVNLLKVTVQTTVARAMGAFFAAQKTRISDIRGPKPEKRKKSLVSDSQSPVILDTSSIIDGRILDVARLGFVEAPLFVPQVVLAELQKIADSSSDLKRKRGRRGLELLESVKKEGVKVSVLEKGLSAKASGKGSVDESLRKLAKKFGARIATVDYNLNKAASVSGVRILNVNELSEALKTVVLPGEVLELKVIQKGKERGQGVGYLDDGTMVVVEDGEGLVGKEARVEVSRLLQSEAGKMVFARPVG